MFYGKMRNMEKKNNFAKWGLPLEEIINLAERLSSFYERFSQCFHTQTRDTSEYGLKYISGLLRMETDRNLANVGGKTESSGQNLQHFVSNSSWSRERVIVAVEEEVKVHPCAGHLLIRRFFGNFLQEFRQPIAFAFTGIYLKVCVSETIPFVSSQIQLDFII
jgi:hypothetical protein